MKYFLYPNFLHIILVLLQRDNTQIRFNKNALFIYYIFRIVTTIEN